MANDVGKSRSNRASSSSGWSRLYFENDFDRLTHYLFRYPAKFHPPVVRKLLQTYTAEGQLVLDPFCGSGTLLVEAAVLGRPSIGMDVDPVAVAVSEVKAHRYQIGRLQDSTNRVLRALEKHRREAGEYALLMFDDLTDEEYESQLRPVRRWVPEIPNLLHWFRRYVVIDLARILQKIESVQIPETHRRLLRVVFASIIRNASNADPVPVSGLEVTSYMKKRDAEGRLIDPFSLLERALDKAITVCESFTSTAPANAKAIVVHGDATQLDRHLEGKVDAVITSPPYQAAVDYYRRHQLEMFWLGRTPSVEDRRFLLNRYVGRLKVAKRHPYVAHSTLETALARQWEKRIRRVAPERADGFRHYLVSMTRFFDGLAKHVVTGGPIVMVLGHSTWNGARIPTTKLFKEVAGKSFLLEEVFWYPVKNRYMSYSRHNNADINTEYVLVMRRKRRRASKKGRASGSKSRK